MLLVIRVLIILLFLTDANSVFCTPDNDTNEATITREELIIKMAARVNSYKVQRSFANIKSKEVKDEF